MSNAVDVPGEVHQKLLEICGGDVVERRGGGVRNATLVSQRREC